MVDPNQPTPEPEELDVEYSGPYEGDDRDPKPIGDILPEVEEDIERRRQNTTLLTARNRLIALEHARANGEDVSDAEINTAKDELTQIEERFWGSPPPSA